MQSTTRNVFVYDLGGGTFDVSILKIERKQIEVIATRGDNHLGGTDIDDILVKHCVDQFLNTYGIDLSTGPGNKRALARLRN